MEEQLHPKNGVIPLNVLPPYTYAPMYLRIFRQYLLYRSCIFSFQFNLSFLVEDSKNASSFLVPVVTVCACQNNGVCIQPATTVELQNLTFSRHSLLSCECNMSFTGEFCEIIRDFCSPLSGFYCHPLVNCSNSQGGTCGNCPSGYSGDGKDCAGKKPWKMLLVLNSFDCDRIYRQLILRSIINKVLFYTIKYSYFDRYMWFGYSGNHNYL